MREKTYSFQLKYGETMVNVDIPESKFYGVLYPKELPGVKDPIFAVKQALASPIGSVSLKQMIKEKKAKDVVILVSDITRPAPSYILVPPIIDELVESGITYSDITVVFALGIHRKMSENEKRKLVGEYVYSKVKCVNHNVDDCVYIGTTTRGTPVEVYRPVAKADFVIATGNLELHYFAGYSGGYKALLPGVCSKRTIETNHSMMVMQGATSGKIKGNPVREDIEEAGKLAGVNFIVNAVLNSNEEIVKIVAGDPIKAHREGVKCIDKMYKRKIEKKADIVIASPGGYPKDINLYQAQKGLDNASHAVKDNGSIIFIAECREGLGQPTFESWMKKAKSPDEPIKWLQKHFILGGHKAAAVCRVLEKAKVYLVSNLDRTTTEDIFLTPTRSVAEALNSTLIEYGDKAKILVIPYANSTLPCL